MPLPLSTSTAGGHGYLVINDKTSVVSGKGQPTFYIRVKTQISTIHYYDTSTYIPDRSRYLRRIGRSRGPAHSWSVRVEVSNAYRLTAGAHHENATNTSHAHTASTISIFSSVVPFIEKEQNALDLWISNNLRTNDGVLQTEQRQRPCSQGEPKLPCFRFHAFVGGQFLFAFTCKLFSLACGTPNYLLAKANHQAELIPIPLCEIGKL